LDKNRSKFKLKEAKLTLPKENEPLLVRPCGCNFCLALASVLGNCFANNACLNIPFLYRTALLVGWADLTPKTRVVGASARRVELVILFITR
jgi:hypothetical protein